MTATGMERPPASAPSAVGVAVAVRLKPPLKVGLQVQVAVKFGELPDVGRAMQPGNRFPLIEKVTFDAIETVAVRTIGRRKFAEVTPPAKERALTVA